MGIFSPLHKGRPQSKGGMTKTGKPSPAGPEQPWLKTGPRLETGTPEDTSETTGPASTGHSGDPVGRLSRSGREGLMARAGFVMDRDKYVYPQR